MTVKTKRIDGSTSRRTPRTGSGCSLTVVLVGRPGAKDLPNDSSYQGADPARGPASSVPGLLEDPGNVGYAPRWSHGTRERRSLCSSEEPRAGNRPACTS